MSELTGLTDAEVRQRIAEGRVNDVPDAPVRTLGQTLRANVFTPVNAIMVTLFVLILVAGYPRDGLFVGVVFSNAVIGIAQELRARRELERLALLSAPRARVVRDGIERELPVSEVVADDLLALGSGDQVVVDGEVLETVGLQLDESLLTGEIEPVDKELRDEVLSGSFVAAGSGHYRATRIGAEAYATQLAEQAKRFKLVDSELRSGINTVLRWLVVLIPPAALLLFFSLLDVEPGWQEALQGTVAAAVAMVPDGLVLLTSLAFVAGVLALARRQALAKELATVELLARVDVLCLDKTGTITTGEIRYAGIEPLGGQEALAAEALGALATVDPDPNATLRAVAGEYAAPDGWTVAHFEPFSSARKWSAASFDGRGVFFLGAPEVLLTDDDEPARAAVSRHASEGRRVLLLSQGDGPFDGRTLDPTRRPVALVLLEDTVRPDAPEILAFFRRQGVMLRVISGDNPETVSAVAQRAGVPDADRWIDARTVGEDRVALAASLQTHAVFGRVTPHQKQAMVGALQSEGHVVAMTGDGVNDVLALKDADMGIAMGSGSAASRSVAQLVLLDNRFATLPRVLAEGRKVINNIERVANLFVTKAAYAVLLTAAIGIMSVPFPLLPRQLTLIGTFSIGVPGFFLALAPNVNLVRPGFLDRVLRFSIPAGVVAAAGALTIYEITRRHDDVTLAESRTVTTMTLLGLGLVILVVISRPLRLWKVGLAVAMALSYLVVMAVPPLREYFELELPPGWVWGPTAAIVAVGALLITAIPRVVPGLDLGAAVEAGDVEPAAGEITAPQPSR